MSCHILSPLHFNTVEQSLVNIFGDKNPLYNSFFNDYSPNAVRNIIKKMMYSIKKQSLNYLYPHDKDKSGIEFELGYLQSRLDFKIFDGIELYNLMRSILYQFEITGEENESIKHYYDLFISLYNDLGHNVLLDIVNKKSIILSV